ncbi:uncharacterized protein LOC135683516 [Rhopilema esculentum]|uniref:uncharacterized protein LOC135683516 n=1 Tax=Rhopilema esculentum TaxID=499914 RepID=UPI0031D49267
MIAFLWIAQAFVIVHASRFTENPGARITKALGDNVALRWKHTIYRPSELVRLECGYLNASRQMTKLMEQLPSENQPRTTVAGTRFENRAYIKDSALVLTNLRAEDTGIYFCIMKVYDSQQFRTVTVRSPDSYLSIGGPKSDERSGMSSSTRTTIIAIIVVVVVLVVALFAFFFFKRRDHSKRRRIPTKYDDSDDVKNGNGNFSSNGSSKSMKEQSEKRSLTTSDIEVVSSPMEAVKKAKSDRSFSSHQAYETVPDREIKLKRQQMDSWPEPPTPTKTTAEKRDNISSRTPPPSRTPPRVLPKPPMQKAVSEDMFV